jgi:hypothetical protein
LSKRTQSITNEMPDKVPDTRKLLSRDFQLNAVQVRRAHLGGRQLCVTIPKSWLKHFFVQLPHDPVGEITMTIDDQNRLVLEAKVYKEKTRI